MTFDDSRSACRLACWRHPLATDGVRSKGDLAPLLHAAALRVAKTPQLSSACRWAACNSGASAQPARAAFWLARPIRPRSPRHSFAAAGAALRGHSRGLQRPILCFIALARALCALVVPGSAGSARAQPRLFPTWHRADCARCCASAQTPTCTWSRGAARRAPPAPRARWRGPPPRVPCVCPRPPRARALRLRGPCWTGARARRTHARTRARGLTGGALRSTPVAALEQARTGACPPPPSPSPPRPPSLAFVRAAGWCVKKRARARALDGRPPLAAAARAAPRARARRASSHGARG